MEGDLRGDDVEWAHEVVAQPPTVVVTFQDILERLTAGSLRGTHSKKHQETIAVYRAFRDCLPPRTRSDPIAGIWRVDLVAYEGVFLPNDEPCRSFGHWNPRDQVEAFEVLVGHTMMLALDPENGVLQVLNCVPGATWLLPAGSFHLTYALQPSLVINTYNSVHLQADKSKYDRGSLPQARMRVVDGLPVVDVNGPARPSFVSPEMFPPSSCREYKARLRHLHSVDDAVIKSVLER